MLLHPSIIYRDAATSSNMVVTPVLAFDASIHISCSFTLSPLLEGTSRDLAA